MNRILEKIAIFIGVAAIIVISYWLGQQAYNWMPTAATVEAKHVDDLFSFLVALGSFVFLGVVGTIAFSMCDSFSRNVLIKVRGLLTWCNQMLRITQFLTGQIEP